MDSSGNEKPPVISRAVGGLFLIIPLERGEYGRGKI
jgi:hypothetical protein